MLSSQKENIAGGLPKECTRKSAGRKNAGIKKMKEKSGPAIPSSKCALKEEKKGDLRIRKKKRKKNRT